MANEVLQKIGTPIVWADTTDYSSTGSGYTRTHQLDLTGVLNGEAREGAKADLGATFARQYALHVGIEFQTAPASDGSARVDFYWYSSHSATAGTGNSAGAGGSDADYQNASEVEWLRQARFIGSLVCTADASTTVQRAQLWCPPGGLFIPPQRYGGIIVLNNGGQTFNTADANEMYVALVPVTDEVQ